MIIVQDIVVGKPQILERAQLAQTAGVLIGDHELSSEMQMGQLVASILGQRREEANVQVIGGCPGLQGAALQIGQLGDHFEVGVAAGEDELLQVNAALGYLLVEALAHHLEAAVVEVQDAQRLEGNSEFPRVPKEAVTQDQLLELGKATEVFACEN